MMDTNDILTLIIAGLALFVSCVTYWDSNHNFKLDTTVGKDAMLSRITVDGAIVPLIKMNICFINNGGKTDSIEDVKLKVEISGAGIQSYKHEFLSAREFTDIFVDSAPSTEILPIVVNGKSNTVKRYGFRAFPNMTQAMVPAIFNIKITLYAKMQGSWQKQKSFQTTDVTGVWNDFDNRMTTNSIIIALEKVN